MNPTTVDKFGVTCSTIALVCGLILMLFGPGNLKAWGVGMVILNCVLLMTFLREDSPRRMKRKKPLTEVERMKKDLGV